MNNKTLELVAEGKLEFKTRPIPEAPPRGLVVKIYYAGICHSDLHTYENKIVIDEHRILRKTDIPGFSYPVILGHEISGVIHSVGPEIEGEDLDVGDRVMVYPWGGCRKCDQCRCGRTSRCPHSVQYAMGICKPGGFQQYLEVSDSSLVQKIPPTLPLDVAALLPCSGLTAYHAVIEALPTVKEFIDSIGFANLLIVGAGGIGLWTVDIAKVLMPPKTTIIVADLYRWKVEQARKLGADKTILWSTKASAAENARKTLSVLPNKIHAAIDLVNNKETAGAISQSLQRYGMWVMVGHYGGCVNLPLPLVTLSGITIKGICYGDMMHLQHLTELVLKRKVIPPVVNYVNFEEAEYVLLQLSQGLYQGRAVIKHDTDIRRHSYMV